MGSPVVEAERPIRVAVVTSREDPRLRYLLEDDPDRGETYRIVGGFVNDAGDGTRAVSLLEAHGVPVECRDVHDFHDERDADLGDMAVREEFDALTAETLAGYDPDLVVLAGYLHVLTAPVLDPYFPAIVNAHHGDLTVRNASGVPVYTGLTATEDAIRTGEASTHETTHLVTEEVDTGPVVARSRPFEVHRGLVESALAADAGDEFDAYVYAHRSWMVREGGGPTLAKTIELLADGRVTYEDGETLLDGQRGYYQLGTGPVHASPPDDDGP